MKDNQVSRLLSLVLRHEPGKIGIVLDNHGWTDIADLLRLANNAGYVFDRDTLLRVVATSDKQRFTISPDGKLIRAAQGHSVQVDLNLPVSQPPARLWHGTARPEKILNRFCARASTRGGGRWSICRAMWILQNALAQGTAKPSSLPSIRRRCTKKGWRFTRLKTASGSSLLFLRPISQSRNKPVC